MAGRLGHIFDYFADTMLPLATPDITEAQLGDPDVGKAWTAFHEAWSAEAKTAAGAFAEFVQAMAGVTGAYESADIKGGDAIRLLSPNDPPPTADSVPVQNDPPIVTTDPNLIEPHELKRLHDPVTHRDPPPMVRDPVPGSTSGHRPLEADAS
ncbi:hypothetical protein ACIHDR_47770 [Nocardia sp. NPDC052278]|uniref:hypothetical protein n=1 Tax=unclassified Nocardia TaxID=2637762 RepID=UPI0036B86131